MFGSLIRGYRYNQAPSYTSEGIFRVGDRCQIDGGFHPGQVVTDAIVDGLCVIGANPRLDRSFAHLT